MNDLASNARASQGMAVVDKHASLADCILAMRAAPGVRAAAGILQHVGRIVELPTVAVMHDVSLPYGPRDETGTKLADVFGWPRRYTEHWEKRQNSFHASVVLRCRSEQRPFCWRTEDAAPARGEAGVSPKSRRIARELAALGLRAALVVPIHLPRGRVAVVGWWGDLSAERLRRLVEDSGAPLSVLANQFIEGLREIGAEGAKTSPPAALSGREIECLTLAANGFTDGEMAARLGLSVHTVRFHLNNAATKLDARNRTHAVGLAAQGGIIGLVDAAPARRRDH